MNNTAALNNKNKKQANLRLFVILFGVGLGAFIFSNKPGMSTGSIQTELNPNAEILEASVSNLSINDFMLSEVKPKLKTQHNFLVACLMRESGFERKNKNAESPADFLTNIKQIRQVVIRHIPGIF